jgi:hypothetical protein
VQAAAQRATGTSLTTSFGSAVTAGNYLLVYLCFDADPGTITPSTGFSLLDSNTSVGATNKTWGYVYSKLSASGSEDGASWSWTNSSTQIMICAESSGVDQATPTDVVSHGATGETSTTQTAASVTTAFANEQVYYFMGNYIASGGSSPTWNLGSSTCDFTRASYNVNNLVTGALFSKAQAAASALGTQPFDMNTATFNVVDGGSYMVVSLREIAVTLLPPKGMTMMFH